MDKYIKTLRGAERREFLRWMGVAAAAFGLERWRYLEVLNGLGGEALAQSATAKTRKSIHLVAGSGGLANFTLAFPHPHAATNNDANFALHAPGSGVAATQTDNPQFYVEGSPFRNMPKAKQISAYICNQNQTHTNTPNSNVSAGNSLIAACAAIQAETSAVLPAIVVNNANLFGAAVGAPSAATVPNANGIVGLFDSAASRTLLAASRPGNAQNLVTLHNGLMALNRSASSATAKRFRDAGQTSAGLLGSVLADLIRPTAAQLALYKEANAVQPVKNMIAATAAAMNAMSHGLTRMVVMPAFNDDPHGMFSNGNDRAAATARSIGDYFEGIEMHGRTLDDPDAPGKKLSDGVVVTVTGDTMKQPFVRGNWPDGTPQGTSVMYAWGQEHLKKGWFGGFFDSTTAVGFDPATGANVAGGIGGTAAFSAASAAVLYAIANGQARRIDNYVRGAVYNGLVVQTAPQ